ncbi:MAG: arginine repressor [Melioribacteraceae bacterium]|nr:arginine repressor [Melioribacteraceae bacterium]MCF8263531.1 arginine repressor [Melioribacteraceae bacterium]MCF8411885.1 arginine repressor [Melioribacteraceae bacterium]MCF8431542.1 arginine repressor [Melioribacteraceae bacterium]
MQSKISRQIKIKKILKKNYISSQEELVQYLANDGIEVTQATLSRDFRELGVVRTSATEGSKYTLTIDESGKQIRKLIAFEILNYEHNEHMVVVRTLAGRAQGVAHYIDKLNSEFIIGTIAGDDTVLIIPNSIKNISNLIEVIHKIMNEDQN